MTAYEVCRMDKIHSVDTIYSVDEIYNVDKAYRYELLVTIISKLDSSLWLFTSLLKYIYFLCSRLQRRYLEYP